MLDALGPLSALMSEQDFFAGFPLLTVRRWFSSLIDRGSHNVSVHSSAV